MGMRLCHKPTACQIYTSAQFFYISIRREVLWAEKPVWPPDSCGVIPAGLARLAGAKEMMRESRDRGLHRRRWARRLGEHYAGNNSQPVAPEAPMAAPKFRR